MPEPTDEDLEYVSVHVDYFPHKNCKNTNIWLTLRMCIKCNKCGKSPDITKEA